MVDWYLGRTGMALVPVQVTVMYSHCYVSKHTVYLEQKLCYLDMTKIILLRKNKMISNFRTKGVDVNQSEHMLYDFYLNY